MYVHTSKDKQYYIFLNKTESYVKLNFVVSIVNKAYLQDLINMQETCNLSTYF